MSDPIYGRWFDAKQVPITKDADAWIVVAWCEREVDFGSGEYRDATRCRVFLPGRVHKHSQALGYPPSERADAWMRIHPPPWFEPALTSEEIGALL